MKIKISYCSILALALGVLLLLPNASFVQAETKPPVRTQTIALRAPLYTNPKSGSTFVNDTSIGQIAWVQLSDAGASDDQRARSALLASQTTNYLKATGFGFTVPTGATIGGIVVEVEHSARNLTNSIKDYSVKLVKGGSIQGQNRVVSPAFIGTTDVYKAYGSSTDMWGLTLTPAEANASDFGVVLAYTASQADTIRVDHLRIIIYYQSRVYQENDSALDFSDPNTPIGYDVARGVAYISTANPAQTVCLTFNGADRVGIGRVVGTNQGKMRVRVDGVAVPGSPFDNYIAYSDAYPTTLQSFIWAQEGLSLSSHTVCVEPDGTKNPSSTSTQIGIDYFVIAVGKKMAQRGVVAGLTTMTQSEAMRHGIMQGMTEGWSRTVTLQIGTGLFQKCRELAPLFTRLKPRHKHMAVLYTLTRSLTEP